MQIHQLQRNIPNKKSRRVGRGGKRGKTSGRGTKGQKARAGGKMRPEMRDIIKRLPKLRGYRFASIQEKPVVVNLGSLEEHFRNGEAVTPAVLVQKGIVKRKKGKIPRIKLLGNGAFTKKITVSGCLFSSSAKEKIEKSGGSIE
ncbi:MAG: 50S ribosomal protein L15 [Candidatus Yonathbacteria bacterium]|nr:50S ribosomal protein L15 [Candidatus Yonathbacteria bacterium]